MAATPARTPPVVLPMVSTIAPTETHRPLAASVPSSQAADGSTSSARKAAIGVIAARPASRMARIARPRIGGGTSGIINNLPAATGSPSRTKQDMILYNAR